MNKKIVALAFLALSIACSVAAQVTIPIITDHTQLVLQTDEKGCLYQAYYGERLLDDASALDFPDGGRRWGWEAISTFGNGDYYTPAISAMHHDGGVSTVLRYAGHEQNDIEGGTETTVTLQDDKYPFTVKVYYAAYPKEDVIKIWTEISHREKKPVTLRQYASGMLYFSESEYRLTSFSSEWAREARPSTHKLAPGKQVIDTKLGSRAALVMDPFFEIGLGSDAGENHGKVLLGTLGWTGNFRFTFEVDNRGNLRIVSGVNPEESEYALAAGEVFKTPEFIFTLSDKGVGRGSRNLHDWARNYSLKDGHGDRMSLLNNWENTYFDFDQEKLSALMKEAATLGVDMFLLDDGWFGNGEHARNHDRAGLGDWEENRAKLPGGLKALTAAADSAGVKFGLWIEPEMVNPNSELYERHPEWALEEPGRDTHLFRNQLVLDMSNPKVQEYVAGVVNRLLDENPGIAYLKWDCNAPIINYHSDYLGKSQSHLFVDHVRGVYKVMEAVNQKHPEVPMMLCSGGGGRCDYEALKYFTEFWCSDDTDPVERCYIQWGFSEFFPPKAICNHVTNWNRKASVKFRTDVASMGKLGFDIGLGTLSEEEIVYCQEAIANWKRLKPAILDGDYYRLVSPYDTNHMAVMNVGKDGEKAVVFAYDLHPRLDEKLLPVKLQGLDPSRLYMVEEINLMPGETSRMRGNGLVFSGDYLMKVGLDAFTGSELHSRVIELTAR